MNIKDAKEIDIVNYLSERGIEPEKIVGNNYWYKSPLPNRGERTASFKVNRKINKWYDWGEGKGGNLIDLGILMHQCRISDFLQKLDGPGISVKQHTPVKNVALTAEAENHIQILSTHPITSYPLIKYLRTRRISEIVANKYCEEARYKIGDKSYYALCFKNNMGGYELRNENFKGSSSPKDTTFYDNNGKDVLVFEGFFNFLSHRTMLLNQQEPTHNFLILNSTSFFEKSLPKMQEHETVHLFLDNDKTGQKFSDMALKLNPSQFKDERNLYSKYDDLNDWIMHVGLSQKHRLSQKL
jgi:hypothetical protein